MLEQVILFTILMGFLISVLLSPILIPFLRRLKFGQSIREEGPKSHQKKSGTPTMGGVMIILSIIVTTIVMTQKFSEISPEMFLLLFVTIGYGLLGFLDDYIKVVMKRNLGLTSKQKLIGQIIIAIVFYAVYHYYNFATDIRIPGTDLSFDLGWAYFILVLFMLVGGSNAVNLTDGLDGLLSGTAAIAFGAFAILAWNQSQYDVAIFSVAVVGAVLGFLVFNAHPAKVFMGDTGSLALGGAIVTIAILTKLEILLVIIGGVFVIETLSVILQVISFKTTGKRIFKMSPLHHHYELVGWSEWRVVVTFWAAGLLLAVLGIYIEVWL
ncbi:phospho-N-acetylmuramoyl-pentapeptide-transferase [Bacillus halotolerans]|jgi:phospho-N-acetylmuramoyl-pentapeptide-transferase|uniref:Phospho-N-acetylmuramoyl-pentapeptide-transferase n=1 Tax=Bacillus halotolerans TaxID=260554 RepID=A0A9Q2QQU4_9BACI|nr:MULTISPECIES: phospho-N-acetylmuramoyl-pentapeptide-transferase [Bacillus]MBV7320754.1 phospho-N-acetylmuramoyl-pentapeptide-transferase [Halalkalibacterium halodurans]AZV47856.1 phospho-N-acetylmuramoyl-pentapeptide-transferase [Bacillus halotolerans]KUP33091.1 phospho-N-acetylmuramoyl-pentapeptide-transferase [Bacillus halotolerans]KUP33532.1 phospho-N-acetylmuramoyl-pentapeptide-transferase [Bacillus halotolerans]MBJ7569942.1 phospho-N-acetylmuramoyl-pentapeptide-transferase [Bacillus ha